MENNKGIKGKKQRGGKEGFLPPELKRNEETDDKPLRLFSSLFSEPTLRLLCL